MATDNSFLFCTVVSTLWWLINLPFYRYAKESGSRKILGVWWISNLGLVTSCTISVYGLAHYGRWKDTPLSDVNLAIFLVMVGWIAVTTFVVMFGLEGRKVTQDTQLVKGSTNDNQLKIPHETMVVV